MYAKRKNQENEHGISSCNDKVKFQLSAPITFFLNKHLKIKIVYNLQKSLIIIVFFCFVLMGIGGIDDRLIFPRT